MTEVKLTKAQWNYLRAMVLALEEMGLASVRRREGRAAPVWKASITEAGRRLLAEEKGRSDV